MKVLVQKPFIRSEAEANNKWRNIRIQLEILLVPVEQGRNFLGIVSHMRKHFKKCQCFINCYKVLDMAFFHISVSLS